MPRSEDQLAARLPAARDGAVSAGHLPPVQRYGTALDRVVKERGETEEAELLIDCEADRMSEHDDWEPQPRNSAEIESSKRVHAS
jgi:hypothetical protein